MSPVNEAEYGRTPVARPARPSSAPILSLGFSYRFLNLLLEHLTVLFQPLPGLLHCRRVRADDVPEGGRVIAFNQMGKFVDDDIVDNKHRRLDQPPVEIDAVAHRLHQTSAMTLILASGDGKRNEFGTSFAEIVREGLTHSRYDKWRVELASFHWDGEKPLPPTNRRMMELVTRSPRGEFVNLFDSYSSLVYHESV